MLFDVSLAESSLIGNSLVCLNTVKATLAWVWDFNISWGIVNKQLTSESISDWNGLLEIERFKDCEPEKNYHSIENK